MTFSSCCFIIRKKKGKTETYYILEGEGIFVDDDGKRIKVEPGDVCVIQPGQHHAIENASDYIWH